MYIVALALDYEGCLRSCTSWQIVFINILNQCGFLTKIIKLLSRLILIGQKFVKSQKPDMLVFRILIKKASDIEHRDLEQSRSLWPESLEFSRLKFKLKTISFYSSFLNIWETLTAHTSALEITQLSNVLITDNCFDIRYYRWSKHSIIVSFLSKVLEALLPLFLR